MPIYECDPWRLQYFADVGCPPDIHIPTDDEDAYKFNPGHRWIYDKLEVARSQGLRCGLHDSAAGSAHRAAGGIPARRDQRDGSFATRRSASEARQVLKARAIAA